MAVTATYDVGQEVFAINEELSDEKWTFVKGVIISIYVPDAEPTIHYNVRNKVFTQPHVFPTREALFTWMTANVPDIAAPE